MENVGFMGPWQTNSLDEIVNHHFSHENEILDVKPNTAEYSSQLGINPPVNILKTNTWNSSANSSSPCHQISFSHSNWEAPFGTIKPYEFKACQGPKKNSTKGARFPSSQEHIMAERKRREKLSERLIALSAMVPGLKKRDKASVLGDAIKYVKQLQEQVKTLEEQATKAKSIESVVYVRKCELSSDHLDNISSENNFSGGRPGGAQNDDPFPEIEARSCDKNVLIRIHCEKRKGVVEKTAAEIQKLHLSVVNSNVITFGSSVLNITIIAKMDEDFSLSMEDLVKNLHAALKLFV